jgi:hypothetical protein
LRELRYILGKEEHGNMVRKDTYGWGVGGRGLKMVREDEDG